MTEYSITLPDGTCIEGEHHINVVHMAQILRETDDEADEPNSVSIEASSPAGDSNVYIDDVSVGDRYEDEDDDDSGFTVPYGGHEITLSGDEADEGDSKDHRIHNLDREISVSCSLRPTQEALDWLRDHGDAPGSDEDLKTLQEHIDEAYANGRLGFETDDEADDEDVRGCIESLRRALGRDRPR